MSIAPLQNSVPSTTTASRSPLADPKWELAWSNPSIDTEVLIRNALAKGGFLLLLEAVKAHGIPEVLRQWAKAKPTLTPSRQTEVERQLRNIQIGASRARA